MKKDYLEDNFFVSVYEECEELIRMLVHILKNNYVK